MASSPQQDYVDSFALYADAFTGEERRAALALAIFEGFSIADAFAKVARDSLARTLAEAFPAPGVRRIDGKLYYSAAWLSGPDSAL